MQIDTIDMRLLRVFMAIVEHGGFGGAEIELGLTASTISIHLANLERRLGVKLCHRGRGGFRLTDEGRAVHESAKRLFLAVDDFTAEAAALRGRLVGGLSIGLVDNTITDPRSPLRATIARFTSREGEVHLTVGVDDPDGLTFALVNRRLHAAIGAFPHQVSGVAYTHLYDETNLLYCTAGHPLAGLPPKAVTRERVATSALVGRGYDLERDLQVTGARGHAATVANMEAQLLLILSGNYVGFLPDHFVRDRTERGELVAVRPDRYRQDCGMWLALPESPQPTLIVSTFVDDLLNVNAELEKSCL